MCCSTGVGRGSEKCDSGVHSIPLDLPDAVGHVLAHHLCAGVLHHMAAGCAARAQCQTGSQGDILVRTDVCSCRFRSKPFHEFLQREERKYKLCLASRVNKSGAEHEQLCPMSFISIYAVSHGSGHTFSLLVALVA